ncbi:YqzL family protein [Bacillus mangrovi]|uniref:YqzL family protein n=1 Tax=Metabacillus mangrovi TaxID=1491830 RepID=A0A7X2S3D9_9BACI|nr:YqzL family protein [Metabacillus mangrovi]MTH52463.1 YqzL family protein [Metabacillus mangrovi]
MKDFTWKVFYQTGNIDTYLLFKEMEKEHADGPDMLDEERSSPDFPVM